MVDDRIEALVLYLDNTPNTLAHVLRKAKQCRAEAESYMVRGHANTLHVATVLREWITEEAVNHFPYRDAVTKNCFADEVESLKEYPDWDNMNYWHWVAKHYLGKIDEGVDVEWAIR